MNKRWCWMAQMGGVIGKLLQAGSDNREVVGSWPKQGLAAAKALGHSELMTG